MRSVILTDEQGIEKGTEEIMKAHEGNGMLHKAFSVLIMSPDKKSVLLQQRVAGKLFGLHWANTCCSHPRPGGNGGNKQSDLTRIYLFLDRQKITELPLKVSGPK
jgi:isopentenyl-diphosphate delta-isomerase type 1